jgi:hypothetical protein
MSTTSTRTPEEGWLAVEAALATGELFELGRLVEVYANEILGADAHRDTLRLLEARLHQDDRYVSHGPRHWGLAGKVPTPPRGLRLPTVHVIANPGDRESVRATLEATTLEVRTRRQQEAIQGMSVCLRYHHLAHGAIRPSKRSLHLFPSEPQAVVVRAWTGKDWPAWWTTRPHPMLFGMEDWLGALAEPGDWVRFTRVEPGRFVLEDLQRHDPRVASSDQWYYRLDDLARLRKHGLSYAQEAALALADHPEGLSCAALIEMLEARLGLRPSRSTISAMLTMRTEFVRDGRLWRHDPGRDPSWRPHFTATQAMEREGEAYLEHSPYRAVLASLGTTPEPLAYVLMHARPEHLAVVASRGSAPLEEVFRLAGYTPPHRAVVVPDHEDLVALTRTFHHALHDVLGQGFEPATVLVEYTTGTKSMSAAAVLATFGAGVAYAYVGGKRDASQRGIVKTGDEELRIVPAWAERRDRLQGLLGGHDGG